jgi:hypothetical protein
MLRTLCPSTAGAGNRPHPQNCSRVRWARLLLFSGLNVEPDRWAGSERARRPRPTSEKKLCTAPWNAAIKVPRIASFPAGTLPGGGVPPCSICSARARKERDPSAVSSVGAADGRTLLSTFIRRRRRLWRDKPTAAIVHLKTP